MPRPASRRHPTAKTSRSRQPSIRRLLVADALRSWLPPTVALVVLGATMILDALGVVPDRAGAAVAALALLVLGAFVAAAPLVGDEADRRPPALAVLAGSLLWIAILAYPFAARLYPGAPLRVVPLDATAKNAVVVPAGAASRVDVVVDGHLPLAADRRDRTVHYEVDLVDDAGAHEYVSGELGDSWRMRRLGRRGTAPSHFEHLSATRVVDVGSGALRVAEVALTGENGATAVATVYRHRTPPDAVLYALAALLLGGALALDAWWDPRGTATATMITASAAAAALVFVTGAAGHPGLRDVIGSALVGAVVGVPVGATAAWLGRTFVPRGFGGAHRAA